MLIVKVTTPIVAVSMGAAKMDYFKTLIAPGFKGFGLACCVAGEMPGGCRVCPAVCNMSIYFIL